MIFLAFGFCVLSLFGPPLIWVRQYPGKYLWLLATHALFLGCGFSIGHGLLGYGWPLYLLSQVVSLLAVRLTLHSSIRFRMRSVSSRRLLLFFILALIACADLAAIFQKNGWGVAGEGVYFRPPLQSDNERNSVVIEALRRHGGSPFLPAGPFSYQLFWHHWAAGLLFPFEATTLFAPVSGATLATAVFFFFLLFGALHISRPGVFRRKWVLLGIVFLLAVHADLFQLVWTYLSKRQLGIELDWSAEHGFFRNFTLKAAALTSPQHAFFFGLTAIFLSVRSIHRHVLAVGAYLCSPVLALLFYVPFFGIEWLRHGRTKEALGNYFAVLLVALAAFGIVLQTPPWEIFFRAVRFRQHWGLSEPTVWLMLPLGWLACMGVPGILATVWALRSKWDWSKWWLVSVSALIFLVAADTEVRRHYSMLFGLVLPFFLLRYWPETWSRAQTVLVRSVVGLAALAHIYFLYAMLGKPSHLNPAIPWKDYFALNDFVRAHLSGEPILAAANPHGVGLDMPLVMEVTPSFSLQEHALIHSRVTPRQLALFQSLVYAGDSVTVGKELGYRYIVWGPVEEFTWGERVRRRFLGNRLFRQGSVGLFTLEDHDLTRWRQEVRRLPHPTLALAQRLEAGGWDREAKKAYELAVYRHPDEALPWLGLSRLYYRNKNGPIALDLASKALERDARLSEAHFIKGLALTRLGRAEEGVPALREAVRLSPKKEEFYLGLLQTLRNLGHRADAESVLKQGMVLATTKDDLQIEQAMLWQSEGRVAEAEALYKKATARKAARLEKPTP